MPPFCAATPLLVFSPDIKKKKKKEIEKTNVVRK
jgi:hypothetical protein